MGLIFALVVLVAAAVWLTRGLRARRARARLRTGPGSSLDAAIPIRSFAEIDAQVANRDCHCGTRFTPTGEGARELGGRRYRFARLACDECEEGIIVYFDVTEVLH